VQPAALLCAVLIAAVAATDAARAADVWILDRQAGDKGCSLSRMDRGRPFSLTLAPSGDAADHAVLGLAFDEPKLMQDAKKAVATLEFDNGTSEHHRLGTTSDGHLWMPIVARDLQDLLRTFSDSSNVTVATRFGSTSFDLDGLGARIPDLRACAKR
jgi:hypothetical protein